MSANIPTQVLSQQLRTLVNGDRIVAAVFTTFTLDPQFFELEVLPLLAGDELSQDVRLRRLQLQEQLRDRIGPIAVYYDRSGLRPAGPAQLEVQYAPVHLKTGLFHPKLVVVLTRPQDASANESERLIVGALSSNMTEDAWWASLECAHFEVVHADTRCGFRDDLVEALRRIRGLGRQSRSQDALEMIIRWIERKMIQYEHATGEGRLHPRLVAGTAPVVAFLEETRGDKLTGCSMEVVSPFFDEKDASLLNGLVSRFRIRETRVFLPRSADGSAACTPEFSQALTAIEGASWGKLPERMLKLGKEAKSQHRYVHAKVYRFTKRSARYEAVLVGSHNLTTSAHQRGGNFEASFLVEREDARPNEWWLDVESKPRHFQPEDSTADLDTPTDVVIPLQLRFDWSTRVVEALWEGSTDSPAITLDSAGIPLCSMDGLQPGEWIALDEGASREFERALANSALVRASTPSGSADLLVQETSTGRKPSLVVSFTVQDILEYWSRLTAEQRANYLESHFATTLPESFAITDRIVRTDFQIDSFFKTYAGVFHGFDMLRKQVSESVAEGNARRADYLLLGPKHDSLPQLIEKIYRNENERDAVESYLIAMCARQLLRELKDRDDRFFADRRAEIVALLARVTDVDALTARLQLGDDGEQFLRWFERHFLKRLEAESGSVDD